MKTVLQIRCFLLFSICVGFLPVRGEGEQWEKDKQAIGESLYHITRPGRTWLGGVTAVPSRSFQDRVLELITDKPNSPIHVVCVKLGGFSALRICMIVTESVIYKAQECATHPEAFRLSTHDYPTYVLTDLDNLRKTINEYGGVDYSRAHDVSSGLCSFRKEDGRFQSIFFPFITGEAIDEKPLNPRILRLDSSSANAASTKRAYVNFFDMLSTLPEKTILKDTLTPYYEMNGWKIEDAAQTYRGRSPP